MAPHSPSPEEMEQTFFILRWWRELTLGLIALLSSVALVKKGRQVGTVPIYITDDELKLQLELHLLQMRRDMEKELREEWKKTIKESHDDLFLRFQQLLAAHNEHK